MIQWTTGNNMTDSKELESLMQFLRQRGVRIAVTHSPEGYIDEISFKNAKGFGPYPMSPLAAAERMRMVVFRAGFRYDQASNTCIKLD